MRTQPTEGTIGAQVMEQSIFRHEHATRPSITPGRKPEPWYELASRRSGGTLVRLYWRPPKDEIIVCVKDRLTGERFVLEPPKSSALTAFYHPYALRGGLTRLSASE
jgi:hypothetical protein